MLLNNHCALVTGASRGIGLAIANALRAQGAIVIGTATTQESADRITSPLSTGEGVTGFGLVLDVSDEASRERVLEQIQEIRPEGISLLVNNAGITDDTLMLRMKASQWDKVIATNLTGAQRLMQACLRPMMKARRGRIINISSVVACRGNPGQANYVASKAGLIGLTKSLAWEVASRGITVNAVAPGFIETDMTNKLNDAQKEAILSQVPIGRLGQATDIANAVIFLASDAASYITGETLHINGGLYMP